MNCRECGEYGCERSQSKEGCLGPVCQLCSLAFNRRRYSGNLARAQRARDQHQGSHPTHLWCAHCRGVVEIEYLLYGEEALVHATQKRDDHQANCRGWPCPHCSDFLKSPDALKRHEVSHWDNGTYKNAGREQKDDEHAILLGATVMNEFCLVAWHCEEQRLFRVIGFNKFWSQKDFEELKLQDGDGFRFRRHLNQRFEQWNMPHIKDNIRVFDISPANVEKSILVSLGSVSDLLTVDAYGPEQFSDDASSFALLNVTNLQFYERGNHRVKLRCCFRDSAGEWFKDVPVVNYNLQQLLALQRVPVPPAAETTVVLGLSCKGYQLMFDSWLSGFQ